MKQDKKKNVKKITVKVKRPTIAVSSDAELYISTGGAKLVLPEDTIRRVLHEYKDKLSKNNNWIGWASGIVPLWGAIFTSKFDSDIVLGVYICLCIGFTVVAGYFIIWAIFHNSKDLITDVVKSLKECSTRTK